MSQRLSRQVALTAVLASCMLIVVISVALGIGANTTTALSQAFPLALVCAVGLAFLIADPFASR